MSHSPHPFSVYLRQRAGACRDFDAVTLLLWLCVLVSCTVYGLVVVSCVFFFFFFFFLCVWLVCDRHILLKPHDRTHTHGAEDVLAAKRAETNAEATARIREARVAAGGDDVEA